MVSVATACGLTCGSAIGKKPRIADAYRNEQTHPDRFVLSGGASHGAIQVERLEDMPLALLVIAVDVVSDEELRVSTAPPTSVIGSSSAVLSWRTERLIAAGLPVLLARSIAADGAHDLHALLSLVDRGCTAELAARILAPLEETQRPL